MSQSEVQISFEGRLREFNGTFTRRSKLEAFKKGLMGWGICWLFSALFMFVPYVNVSVFLIFIPTGPIVLLAIFFISQRTISTIDGTTQCPKCEKPVEIHERNVTPPIYEHCPSCKAGFEILIPPR